MNIIRTAVILTALAASAGAFAQNPPAKDQPGNNAVNTDQKNSTAPVSGRNSFTESQAQSAIEKAGYANPTGLKKDDNGIWRGKATKDGKSTDVSIDFQGNVNAAR